MKTEKKIYFVSDAHLGTDAEKSSEEREKMLISWLDEIKIDAKEIFLLGDIFDFWFEYKYIVPKNFIAFLYKLREISESGIIINFFTGNHDMWTFGYLAEICKMNVFYKADKFIINNKVFFIGHGDGLGHYDKKYNFLKKIFSAKFFQFLFKTIHPSISFRIANKWSKSNRKKHKKAKHKKTDDLFLVKYARKIIKNENINYFVLGHQHIALQIEINENCIFTNTGDWLTNFTYAVYDGEKIYLKKYNSDNNNNE